MSNLLSKGEIMENATTVANVVQQAQILEAQAVPIIPQTLVQQQAPTTNIEQLQSSNVESSLTTTAQNNIVANGTATSIENILNAQIFGVSVKKLVLIGVGIYIFWEFVLDRKTKRNLKFW